MRHRDNFLRTCVASGDLKPLAERLTALSTGIGRSKQDLCHDMEVQPEP